ncbi:MAG: hypothetical protein IPO37_03555 [Saprospiraceae bacterium]|nr:hypothetical protein [Saprospiraceae bacterium]
MNSKVVLVSMALFISPAFILLQPDFGSALVYFSFFILLYRRAITMGDHIRDRVGSGFHIIIIIWTITCHLLFVVAWICCICSGS